jgi:DNA replication and repair protein RecF
LLSRLVLTDFRNHAALTLAPGPGFVVLTGENGAGKTNVLEAVSLLAPGRGLRRAALSAMARQGGTGGFGVAATVAGDVEIGTGTAPSAPERRLVRVQGAAAAATSLPEWLTVLWLTPATDRLFVEPAGERRRFLDRLVLALSPGHATHAARYEAAMRERNRLLSDANGGGRPADPAWLTSLEARMAEHGAAIDTARTVALQLLAERLNAAPPGPFPRASLRLEGEPIEPDGFAHALAIGRRRDAAAGRALVGPHRADLAVTHVEKAQAAALASTGEQKALLLGIVLAHAELVADRTGRAPVLLLDEVAAHLDPPRREGLFARLAERGQTWMTGTEPALFAAIGGSATRIAIG